MIEDMWNHCAEKLAQSSVLNYRISINRSLTYGEVIQLWRDDEEFRAYFAEILREAPFQAYRWETPPMTSGTLERAFEFVLIDCPSLSRSVDRSSFQDFFSTAGPDSMAIAFENLGRDATLVVPCPPTDSKSASLDHFAHLASFMRKADNVQVDAFWQLVGQTMSEKVNDQPIWLSTAGMGVAWLHVRLDQRPKYYAHGPYREEQP